MAHHPKGGAVHGLAHQGTKEPVIFQADHAIDSHLLRLRRFMFVLARYHASLSGIAFTSLVRWQPTPPPVFCMPAHAVYLWLRGQFDPIYSDAQVIENALGRLSPFPNRRDHQIRAAHHVAAGKDFWVGSLELERLVLRRDHGIPIVTGHTNF